MNKDSLLSWLNNNIEAFEDGFDPPGSRAELASQAVAAAYRTLIMRIEEGMFDEDKGYRTKSSS